MSCNTQEMYMVLHPTDLVQVTVLWQVVVVMYGRMVDWLKIPGSHKRVVIEAQVVPRESWMVVVVQMNAHHHVDMVDWVDDLVL